MPKKRAKGAGEKAKKNVRRSGHEWDVLRTEFGHYRGSLRKFCEVRGIPYGTAVRHIRPRADKSFREEIEQRRAAVDAELKQLLDVEHAKRYLGTLIASSTIVKDVMLLAHASFVTRASTSKEAASRLGRLALSASEQLTQVNRELQGIPDDESPEGACPSLRGFEPLWYQRDFCFDWPSNLETRGQAVRILSMVAGIGTGKSRCGAWKARELARMNRGLPIGIFGPTHKMLQKATLPAFMEECAAAGISARHEPSNRVIVVYGDTPVHYWSLEEPDNIRGPNLAAAWADELLQLRDRRGFDVMMGRIRHPEAKERAAIITATPHGFTWGHDVLVHEAEKNKVLLYQDARTEYNTFLPEGYAEDLYSLYDDMFARQELGGEFVDLFKGKAYYKWQKAQHVLPARKTPYDPSLPLILSCDFNVSPMCWVVAQSFHHADLEEVSYVIDELFIDTADTELAALEFCRRWGKHVAGVKIYGDAAGRARHTSATRTDYQIIEDVLDLKGIPRVEILVGKSNPQHDERVRDVNARLYDARGRRRLFVSDRCQNLILDMDRVAFVPGTRTLVHATQKPKNAAEAKLGHMSDALGYYVNREHAIRRVRYGRS